MSASVAWLRCPDGNCPDHKRMHAHPAHRDPAGCLVLEEEDTAVCPVCGLGMLDELDALLAARGVTA